MPTAIGVRPHTGWAILVAVDGEVPAVLRRERIELCPPELPRQVYHDVGERKLPTGRAQARISLVEAAVEQATRAALRDAVHATGAQAIGLVAEARALPELPSILRAHPLWHAAEGQLYRDALAAAAERLRLPVLDVPPRRVRSDAKQALSLSDAKIDALLRSLGSSIGPPWQRDHKDAALAALVALAS